MRVHAMVKSLSARSHASLAASLAALSVCAVLGLAAMGTVLVRPYGQQTGEQFGYAVAGRGDINNDGFDDFVVGAPLFDSSAAADRGRVIVYFGGASPNEAADAILLGQSAGDHFGWSVALAKVNGDAFADIIVGAPLNDAGGADAGRAYVYFGGSPPDAIADATFTGAAAGDHFGWSVSGGDVRKNTLADAIVGAPLADSGAVALAGDDIGRTYVFLGGSPPDAIADIILQGEKAGDNFGWSVSYAQDVNGDLIDDIVVGAPLNDTGTTDAGKGYVYFGDTTPLGPPNITYTSPTPSLNGHFGWSVAGAGTFSTDALGDVVIGAPQEDPVAGADAGKAYAFYGVNNAPSLTFTGVAAGDNLGYAVAGAGDVDANGSSEIIVGSPLNDATGSNAGRADVFFGGAFADATSDVSLFGEAASDQFGFSCASAGDINNDSTDEVVVGAPLHDPPAKVDGGRAYIFMITTSSGGIPSLSPVGVWSLAVILAILVLRARRRPRALRAP